MEREGSLPGGNTVVKKREDEGFLFILIGSEEIFSPKNVSEKYYVFFINGTRAKAFKSQPSA